jgi:putative ATPase
VKDVRDVLEAARRRLEDDGQRTCLFIDEIHRFNKAQQDVLLPDVENGVIALIGATTQNPFFALTSALVSRSRIFELECLSKDDVGEILDRAPPGARQDHDRHALGQEAAREAAAHPPRAGDPDRSVPVRHRASPPRARLHI